MSPLAVKILLWLMSLQPVKSDAETYDERRERMLPIAEVVADVSNGNRELAAFILVDFKRESDFSRRVQVCDCPEFQCDWDRKAKVFRAHGLAQIHKAPAWTIEKWDAFCGNTIDATRLSALFVSYAYLRAKTRKQPLACAFSELGGIGTLVGCLSPWAKDRAAAVKRLEGKL